LSVTSAYLHVAVEDDAVGNVVPAIYVELNAVHLAFDN
jgi:hypothetical protein